MMRLFALASCALLAVAAAAPAVSAQLVPGQDIVVDYVAPQSNSPAVQTCPTTVTNTCNFLLGNQLKVTTLFTQVVIDFNKGLSAGFGELDFNGVRVVIAVAAQDFTAASIASQFGFIPALLPGAVTFDADHIYVNLQGLTIEDPTTAAQIVINFLNTPPRGGAVGDPQISGFLGQSFQVHGAANTVYSIISSAKLQYNALFSFLSEGKCRTGTECFAHAGNYFGAVAMLIKQESGKVAKVEVTAGPVAEGMKVTIDGEPLTPAAKHLEIDSETSIHFGSQFEMLLQTRDYTLRLENSDMFLNQQISIRTPLLEQIKQFKSKAITDASQLPHGILGQTWRRMSYPNRWVHIEGDLMNYIVADGLLGVPQEMNRFHAQA